MIGWLLVMEHVQLHNVGVLGTHSAALSQQIDAHKSQVVCVCVIDAYCTLSPSKSPANLHI